MDLLLGTAVENSFWNLEIPNFHLDFQSPIFFNDVFDISRLFSFAAEKENFGFPRVFQTFCGA